MTQDPWEALASDLNGGASSTDPWEALASEVNGSAAPAVAPQGYSPRQAALESAQAAQAATAGLSMPSEPLSPQINGEGPLAPERLPTAEEFNQQVLSSGAAGLAELPAGLSDAVAIASTWLGNATGFDQQPLEKRATRKFAQAIREFVREAVPPAPEEAGLGDSFLASKLPGALGQGVGFIGAGAMGQLAKVPAMMSSAVLGGAQNAQSQFWEAMAETGGDEEKAYEAFAWGLGAGATEAFGLGRLAARLNQRTGGRLTRAMAGALHEGLEEGAQETLQTVFNNAIAQHTYDDERELLRGWLENASLGMLSGGLLGGFLNAVSTPSLGPSEQQVAQEAVEVAEEVAAEVAPELEAEPEAEGPAEPTALETFRSQVEAVPNITPEQADATTALLEARAASAGVTPDQYLEERGLQVVSVPGIESLPTGEVQPQESRQPEKSRGYRVNRTTWPSGSTSGPKTLVDYVVALGGVDVRGTDGRNEAAEAMRRLAPAEVGGRFPGLFKGEDSKSAVGGMSPADLALELGQYGFEFEDGYQALEAIEDELGGSETVSDENQDEYFSAMLGEMDAEQLAQLEDQAAAYGFDSLDEAMASADPSQELADDIEDLFFQEVEGRRVGSVDFVREGETVIRAFGSANVSTLVHELGHVFRRDLDGATLKQAATWAGAADPDSWSAEAEERFATAFERYMRDGKAPTPELAGLFARFREWLRGVYRSLKGTPVAERISPDMRRVFDRLLTPGAMAPAAETAPTTEPGARNSENPMSEGLRGKLVALMEETKPLREKQTELVREWRDEQTARVRGAKAAGGTDLDRLNAMAGELAGGAPVVEMEDLEGRFTEAEMQELASHFFAHSIANDMSPQEHSGLWFDTQKLLRHGVIPAPGALEKLGRIFGRDFAEAVSADYDGPRWPGLRRFLLEALNTPRALKASFDLSAAGRQGLSMGLMHPGKVIPAFVGQLRAFRSQEYSDRLTGELRSSHWGKIFRRYGGEFTLPAGKMEAREEAFMSTWLQDLADAELRGWERLLEPVKLLGRGVRASDRAYAAYLNKMRLEVFSYWAQQYEAAGVEASPRQYRKLAKFVNALSGRGKAGPFEGEVWTALLWSPRFVTSRFEAPARALMQGFSKGDAVAIRSGWQALVSHSMAAIGLAALVKYAADLWDEDDLEVGLDWRSSDFLKIRHGSTRIDMAGGYGPAARLVAAWAKGERKNILSGKTEKTNPLISTLFFMRNKLAPVPSVAVSNLTGTDPTGEEPTAGSSLGDLYLPIAAQTFGEVMEEHGAVGLGYMVPELLGFGVNVHDYDAEKGEGAGDRTYHYNHLEDALRRGDEEKARAAWAALMSDRLATKDGTNDTKRARTIRRTMERRGRGGDLLDEIAK